MHENSTGAWRSRFPKAVVPIGIVVALAIVILAAICLRPTSLAQGPVSETLQPPGPPALRGWRIEIEAAAKEDRAYSGICALKRVAPVPPGARFTLHVEPRNAVTTTLTDSGEWRRFGGSLEISGNGMTACSPQQPGLYRLYCGEPAAADLDHEESGSQNLIARSYIELLVMSRADVSHKGDRTYVKVNGKSIGGYLDPQQSTIRRVRENAALFQIPKLFATLTPSTAELELGPGFQLSQLIAFKDHYNNDGKKIYTTERHTDVLPLKPELIVKLTKLKERLQSKGVKVTRFWITSGFRTPDYNHSIGGAAFSRHSYGDAVDLCIDEDNDKHMDDLNGDGRVDKKDGLIVGNACRELELEGAVVPGGIGVYEWDGEESVKSHVHVDCRGYISRWGQIGAGKGKKLFTWWPKAEFSDDDAGE